MQRCEWCQAVLNCYVCHNCGKPNEFKDYYSEAKEYKEALSDWIIDVSKLPSEYKDAVLVSGLLNICQACNKKEITDNLKEYLTKEK